MDYITGEIPCLNDEDQAYANWDLNNSLVMAWLINSMESCISRTYLFLPTAKAIWDAFKKNYSDLENASQVLEIKNKLKEMRQGNLDITKYYNALQTLWQELDRPRIMLWRHRLATLIVISNTCSKFICQ